ncbi:hypothetical protein [Fusibacter tunisiensis]|uniref:Uncharacterized protein n=1 Tax=Fusibacter tunisiensis TaxID=1008308 RepID=A0ABS2MNH4_9FIRM|nr:hypothetical protein [Fusibacter tunisiensis]MBM7560944.1 hypothetical protein [Fusibacter tunisiensis]
MKKKPSDSTNKGPLGGTNFLISIRSTQNNTWQGIIEWLDTGEKIHFRSTIEMIVLLKDATDQTLPQHHYKAARSWHSDGNTVHIF